jgi:hypothetical protein
MIRLVLSTTFVCMLALFESAAPAKAASTQSLIVTSAKDLGCAGNGSTDDSACMKAAASSTTSVFFPAGTYKFSDPITVSHAIVFFGQGNGLSRLQYTGNDNTPAITWNPKSNLNYGMGMRDIALYGDSPNGLQIGGDQVSAGFECHACRISDFTGAGLSYGDNAWSVLFDHSEFVNTSVSFPSGLDNSGEQIVYRDTTFASTSGNNNNCVVVGGNTQTIFDGVSFDGCQLIVSNSGAIVTIMNTHFESPNGPATMHYLDMSAGSVELENAHIAVQSFSGIDHLIGVTGGSLTVMNGIVSVSNGPMNHLISASAGKVRVVNSPYLGGVSTLITSSGNAAVTVLGSDNSMASMTTSDAQAFAGPISAPSLSSSGPIKVTSKSEPVTLFPSYGAADNYEFGLGLNCTFDGSRWVSSGDGANNGGTCITATSLGNLEIYPLASSGGSQKTYSTADLSNHLTAVFSSSGETFNRPVLIAGSSPSVSAGSAAGKSPSVSLAHGSTTNKGQLLVETGSAPASNGILANVNFPSSLPNSMFCSIGAGNAATASLSANAVPYISSDPSNKGFTVHGNTTSLSAKTVYRWQYTCF